MTVTNKRLAEILTTAMEKPEIANALIQRVINTLNQQEQREWQGLTDEEVRDLWSWSMTAEAERTANTQQHAFTHAIEAKLKEKNT